MMLSPPPGAQPSPPEPVQSWAGQQPAATHVQGLSQDGEGQDEEEEDVMSGSESESDSPDGSSVMRAIELD